LKNIQEATYIGFGGLAKNHYIISIENMFRYLDAPTIIHGEKGAHVTG
jgi:hypothetical protein